MHLPRPPIKIPPRCSVDIIDQIVAGQQAALRFSAFNQRTTPEIYGRVKFVAADLSHDSVTGKSWYGAQIGIPPSELSKLGSLLLVPGMPVEVFIETGTRTALAYFLKPLSDQLVRALREN